MMKSKLCVEALYWRGLRLRLLLMIIIPKSNNVAILIEICQAYWFNANCGHETGLRTVTLQLTKSNLFKITNVQKL